MDYKYLGYFLAVLILVLGTVATWIVRMFLKEQSLIRRLSATGEDMSRTEVGKDE